LSVTGLAQPLGNVPCAIARDPDTGSFYAALWLTTAEFISASFAGSNVIGGRDLSVWYMEIHRLGGLWVGDDGNLLLDLATDQVFSFR
jgi:hypothetical protein